MSTLLWFQRDLRIESNPALNQALLHKEPIIALYINSPNEDSPWHAGAASRWWLHHSLQTLEHGLAKLNIQLQFFQGDSQHLIPQLARNYSAKRVIWTNRHEPFRRHIENQLDTLLGKESIKVIRCRDELLTHSDMFLTSAKQTPYRVFTPFYKRLRSELDFTHESARPLIDNIKQVDKHREARQLIQLELLDKHPWHIKLHNHWVPGEKSALQQLDQFARHRLSNYRHDRDFPAVDGTSCLSAHLHFGEISPRQVLNTLQPVIALNENGKAAEAESFLRQLIWREFSRYLLHHFPHTISAPMDPRFDSEMWQKDRHSLVRWQKGTTGIAIIDAGMQQLWQSGWMHNRVRMLVASLLTKNLGIHWMEGARWFWDTLVDADLANNTMGWQWVAGCGVDAAPYFRIFNPGTQAKRFDAEAYINRWLGTQHPFTPIADIDASRKAALERYQQYVRGKKV